ncbi:S8 family serine peptidase [Paraconexibacter antarcticus]|uniref:S8 family serine peptidase n=1 Tax=Paraconexibacter antarcticus TaxID=2949664 RepID=A0ABY5E187_9ACTN|nr:S8 family serine peptidase [Paraconexibacter antarcticus]UTI66932.1 S8 family serine peptidase [Paraconexibacter antarcticus]
MRARGPARGRHAPAVLTALALALTGPAAATASAAPDPPTGRLLVTLKASAPGVIAHAASAGLRATGARVAGPVDPRLRLLTVRPAAGAAPRATAAALRALPGVQSVEVEHRAQLRVVPDDPAFTTPETAPGTPPGTVVEWWAAAEDLPQLWDLVPNSEGATVAVIDTGADASHPELASRIHALVDKDTTAGAPGPGTDQVGHGTHVASLACADAGNGVGLAGAGHDCGLIIVKSDLSDSSIAESIMAAVDAGADAINMSFGTDGSRPAASAIVHAVDYAVSKGVVLVAAAADDPVQEQGDPSNVLQPTGSGSDMTQGLGLSVTSANHAGSRSPFAGFGSQISLAAYGSFDQSAGPRGIFGAFPANSTELERPTIFGAGCNCRTTFGGDARYAYIQGTSMAAPMVTAVAADLRHLNPDLSATDIVRILKQTARRPAGTGWTPDLGWGILDGGAAAALTRVADRRPPSTRLTASAKVVRGRWVTLRVRSRDTAPAYCVASGVRKVEIWRASNGGKAHRIATTTKAAYRVRVRRGSRYRFWSIGVDRAGNRESTPLHADTVVTATVH